MGFKLLWNFRYRKKQEVMEDAFTGFIVNDKVLFVCIADGLGAKGNRRSVSSCSRRI